MGEIVDKSVSWVADREAVLVILIKADNIRTW